MSQTTRILLIIASTLLIVVIVSGLIITILGNAPSKSKMEINTEAIEQLLRLAEKNNTGAFPQDSINTYIKGARIEYYLRDDPKCWTFLQQEIVQNSNHYLIKAYKNGGYNPRDVDDSIVQIDFQDGSSSKMVFYQGALVACDLEN